MDLDVILSLKSDQKIAIVGLGKENQQFLNWLVNVVKFAPNQIILADNKEFDLLNLGIEPQHINQITTFFGPDYLDCLKLKELEYVFKAPGIWSLKPEFESFRSAKGQDRILSGLIFFLLKFREQIIGITGTKGKSTTSALVNHILNNLESPNKVDQKSFYCGNTTGISPYQFWTELDQKTEANQWFVVELSSFQLQDLGYSKFSPKYCIITNYFVDHLDQHATKEEYWKAKDQIFIHQNEHDITIYSEAVLAKTQHADRLCTESNIRINSKSPAELYNFIKSPLLGEHNQANVNQAVVMVAAAKLKSRGQMGDMEDICEELRKYKFKYQTTVNKFKGLPHRLELIRSEILEIELNRRPQKLKINFYDDGYATEPDAVEGAVKALTEKNGDFIWLQLTGVDKGPEVTELVATILYKEIENRIYRIDYCGSIGQRVLSEIYKALGTRQNIEVEKFKTKVEKSFTSINDIKTHFQNWTQELLNNFQSIGEYQKIHELLNKPELNLNIALSPCGSSFDEFENYTIRSNWWVEKIQNMN